LFELLVHLATMVARQLLLFLPFLLGFVISPVDSQNVDISKLTPRQKSQMSETEATQLKVDKQVKKISGSYDHITTHYESAESDMKVRHKNAIAQHLQGAVKADRNVKIECKKMGVVGCQTALDDNNVVIEMRTAHLKEKLLEQHMRQMESYLSNLRDLYVQIAQTKTNIKIELSRIGTAESEDYLYAISLTNFFSAQKRTLFRQLEEVNKVDIDVRAEIAKVRQLFKSDLCLEFEGAEGVIEARDDKLRFSREVSNALALAYASEGVGMQIISLDIKDQTLTSQLPETGTKTKKKVKTVSKTTYTVEQKKATPTRTEDVVVRKKPIVPIEPAEPQKPVGLAVPAVQQPQEPEPQPINSVQLAKLKERHKEQIQTEPEPETQQIQGKPNQSSQFFTVKLQKLELDRRQGQAADSSIEPTGTDDNDGNRALRGSRDLSYGIYAHNPYANTNKLVVSSSVNWACDCPDPGLVHDAPIRRSLQETASDVNDVEFKQHLWSPESSEIFTVTLERHLRRIFKGLTRVRTVRCSAEDRA